MALCHENYWIKWNAGQFVWATRLNLACDLADLLPHDFSMGWKVSRPEDTKQGKGDLKESPAAFRSSSFSNLLLVFFNYCKNVQHILEERRVEKAATEL